MVLRVLLLPIFSLWLSAGYGRDLSSSWCSKGLWFYNRCCKLGCPVDLSSADFEEACCIVNEPKDDSNLSTGLQDRNCHNSSDVMCVLPQDALQVPTEEATQFQSGTGTWICDTGAYPIDHGFTSAVSAFFAREKVSRLIDIGSGSGFIARAVASRSNISVLGVDGNFAIVNKSFPESFPSGGRVSFRHLDLTQRFPASVGYFEWALCLAVAHVVPFNFEHVLLSNIFGALRKGLVLMWGPRSLPGLHHMNEREVDELLHMFGKLGFVLDVDETENLQRSAQLGWYKVTVVLRRLHTLQSERAHARAIAGGLINFAAIALREHERACWPVEWQSDRDRCCRSRFIQASELQVFIPNSREPVTCFGGGFHHDACCATLRSYTFLQESA